MTLLTEGIVVEK